MSAERTISEQELLENLGWVRALARRLVGGEADDLVQQVCVAALDRGRIRGVPGSSSAAPRVRAWLARATGYLANNQRRGQSRRRERERVSARPEAQPATHEIVARNALLADLVREVQALGEPYRTTVLLRYLEGRSNAEIAIELDVSEAVVRKRLSRGLDKLRGRLGPRGLDAWAVCVLGPLHPALAHVPTTTTKTLGALTMATATTKTIAGLAAAGLTAAVLINGPGRTPAELSLDEAPTPAVAGIEPILEPLEVADLSTAAEEPVRAPVDLADESSVDGESVASVGEGEGTSSEVSRVLGPDIEDRLVMSYLAADGVEERYLTSDLIQETVTGAGEYRIAYTRVQNLPEDGWHVEAYEDGSRKEAGMIVDGHRQGEWKEWFPDGTLRARGGYDAGQKEGEWKRWNETGELVLSGTYRYGQEHGLHEELNAGLHRHTEFRNGDRHGVLRAYFEDDLLATEEEWFRNRRHGASRTFHMNGELESQGTYEHGRKVGVWNYWNEDGELDEERSGLVEPPDEAEAAVSGEGPVASIMIRGIGATGE